MKNYRKWIPIVMIVFMAISWYAIVSDVVKTELSYNNYLKEARKNAEVGVTKYAIENYNNALALKPSSEIYTEVAKYFEKEGDFYAMEDWCMNFLEIYPEEPAAYEALLKTYYDTESYSDFYEILDVAEKRGVSSKTIRNYAENMKFVYELDYNSYEKVGRFDNNLCPVRSNGEWGFVNRYGEQRAGFFYDKVGKYTDLNVAPVVNLEDEAYFIDIEGAKVMATKEDFISFGPDCNGIFSAELPDENFTFVNEDFEKITDQEYEDVIVHNDGIGAVQYGSKWYIVNEKIKKTTSETFDEILTDEANTAYYNERMFVKNGDKYILVNGKGKPKSDQEYDDAKPFSEGEYAAVEIDGKWSFINKNGKIVSKKYYEEARSFSNGYAAVKINGKWGFINKHEEVVIEPEFYDAKDFTAKGSCFVKTGDNWQLLKIYSMNRKES